MEVPRNFGVTRSSRSSSFQSQASNSMVKSQESRTSSLRSLFRRQVTTGSNKWSSTVQAALSNRERDTQESTASRSAPQTGPADSSAGDGPTRELLYFGKDTATSMWWRFRRGTVGDAEAKSNSQDQSDGAPPLYENSYRMEPKPGCHFRPEQVEAIMTEVLESEFRGKTYVCENGSEVVKRLADEIKNRVKLLHFERYRLVVFIQVGQLEGLDMTIASRCAWNTETDCYATATFQNGWMYAVAITYGIYLD